MRYELAIVSAHRSGSWMLATAIASHPELNFIGELLNTSDEQKGKINFPIIHASDPNLDAIEQQAMGKVIAIKRNKEDRYKSNWTRNTDKTDLALNMHHYQPTEADLGVIPVGEGMKNIHRIERTQKNLLDLMARYDHWLNLDYDELTGNKDIRELPEEVSHAICDYIGVERRALVPDTYKPKFNYELEVL